MLINFFSRLQILARSYIQLDKQLLIIMMVLLVTSLFTMYSAAYDFEGRFALHIRNIIFALVAMLIVANIPPRAIMSFAPYIYTIGLIMLILVGLVGTIKKGSQRWLNIGFEFQPSEIMKIAVPMMLAFFFHTYSDIRSSRAFLIAVMILGIPVLLIIKQPDLGTAILVFAAGFFVIFLAGLPWKILIGMAMSGMIAAPIFWPLLHGYQRERILTLLNPEADPLGKGFQIRQAIIAIGSGGATGKGWLNGSQGHLGFIPERSTDMVLSVYSEEFGVIGILFLLIMFTLLIARGLWISANAATSFSRLLAGSITLIIFTYVFVNMAMVSGIAPVVGIPLPFLTYGGTALMTICVGCGILTSVQKETQLWVKGSTMRTK